MKLRLDRRHWNRVCSAFVAVVISLALHGGARIIDGTKAGTTEYPEVFALTTDKKVGDAHQIGLCTATLIHPRVLVTAAHCADGVKHVPVKVDNAVDIYTGGESIRGRVKTYLASSEWKAAQAAAATQRTAENSLGETMQILRAEANDIAYVLLEEAVDGVKPARVFAPETKEHLESLIDLPLELVGYGYTTVEPPKEITPGVTGVKHFSQSKFEGLNYGRLYRRGMKGNIQSGDSGGPAFVALSGKRMLVGVISSATLSKRTDEERYGYIAPLTKAHLCWIQKDSGQDLGIKNCP